MTDAIISYSDEISNSTAHSFTDDAGRNWTACCECNRGGNGNDPDKCSCGWQRRTWDTMGCFFGTPIVGGLRRAPKRNRAKERYQRYLESGDCFDSFLDFCYWDAGQERY